MENTINLPKPRGVIKKNAKLAPFSWFRVGGEAEILFMPKDEADLALFLSALPEQIPVHVLGVASNTLIRDGGVKGVVIRLGPGFSRVEVLPDNKIKAGAFCLDSIVAKKAAEAGLGGLEFLSTIPGTIGGALRMNAGCYGSEIKDVLSQAIAIDRRGRRIVLDVEDMDYSYRHCGVGDDLIFTAAIFKTEKSEPEKIKQKIQELQNQREKSQPTREKTGGSSFKNPNPEFSDGKSAWQLIDEAGGRGLQIGGAQMSEKHCNFMINTGNASAADLENLGEEIRKRVKAKSGVELAWEIKRIGERL